MANALLQEFHKFLLKHSGVSGQVLNGYFRDQNDLFKTNFFQPYRSKSDPFFRTASVVTAPIALGFVTLEYAAFTIYYGLKALVDLVMLNPSKAVEDLTRAGIGVLLTVGLGVLAIASPVANTVDLIGSGIASLCQNNDNDELEAHSQNFVPG